MLRHTTCGYLVNKPIYLKISEPTKFTKNNILQVLYGYQELLDK